MFLELATIRKKTLILRAMERNGGMNVMVIISSIITTIKLKS